MPATRCKAFPKCFANSDLELSTVLAREAKMSLRIARISGITALVYGMLRSRRFGSRVTVHSLVEARRFPAFL